jgi:hypothetical protein
VGTKLATRDRRRKSFLINQASQTVVPEAGIELLVLAASVRLGVTPIIKRFPKFTWESVAPSSNLYQCIAR